MKTHTGRLALPPVLTRRPPVYMTLPEMQKIIRAEWPHRAERPARLLIRWMVAQIRQRKEHRAGPVTDQQATKEV